MEVYHIGKFRTLLSSHVPVSCTIHHGEVLVATAGYSCKNTVALWHLHGCHRVSVMNYVPVSARILNWLEF